MVWQASLNEEVNVGKHNVQQMKIFMDGVKGDTVRIIKKLLDMEQQLVKYGYTPMEQPSNNILEGTFTIHEDTATRLPAVRFIEN